jgi:hypothetical protein
MFGGSSVAHSQLQVTCWLHHHGSVGTSRGLPLLPISITHSVLPYQSLYMHVWTLWWYAGRHSSSAVLAAAAPLLRLSTPEQQQSVSRLGSCL